MTQKKHKEFKGFKIPLHMDLYNIKKGCQVNERTTGNMGCVGLPCSHCLLDLHSGSTNNAKARKEYIAEQEAKANAIKFDPTPLEGFIKLIKDSDDLIDTYFPEEDSQALINDLKDSISEIDHLLSEHKDMSPDKRDWYLDERFDAMQELKELKNAQ
jgi:hypothetical protein